jgi:calcineurin-like phosphoesterase family protein
MAILFTADEHYGHDNIIKYCTRPYADVKTMNRALIQNYNRVVTDDDTVYHLGDFGFFSMDSLNVLRKFVQQLNGTKILILGNHDRLPAQEYVEAGFRSAHTFLEVDGYLLTHDPCNTIIYPERRWLCGHVHTFFKHCNNTINVGVDQWAFAPVTKDEVDTLFKLKETTNKGAAEPWNSGR